MKQNPIYKFKKTANPKLYRKINRLMKYQQKIAYIHKSLNIKDQSISPDLPFNLFTWANVEHEFKMAVDHNIRLVNRSKGKLKLEQLNEFSLEGIMEDKVEEIMNDLEYSGYLGEKQTKNGIVPVIPSNPVDIINLASGAALTAPPTTFNYDPWAGEEELEKFYLIRKALSVFINEYLDQEKLPVSKNKATQMRSLIRQLALKIGGLDNLNNLNLGNGAANKLTSQIINAVEDKNKVGNIIKVLKDFSSQTTGNINMVKKDLKTQNDAAVLSKLPDNYKKLTTKKLLDLIERKKNVKGDN